MSCCKIILLGSLFLLFLGLFNVTPDCDCNTNTLCCISNTFGTFLSLPSALLLMARDHYWGFRDVALPDYDVTQGEEFDFVVVGAGSGGAALASRLSEIDSTRVLLIEAGGEEIPFTSTPLAFILCQLMGFSWPYQAHPSQDYCRGIEGNSCRWAGGKVMGGSSSINAILATRGNPADYDEWAEMGNEGWSYQDVFPYFKKLENNVAPTRETEMRGQSGPIPVSTTYNSQVAKAFVKAGKERGFPEVDYNGRHQIGFGEMQYNIRDGERISSNRGYLHPLRGIRENLKVSKNSLVKKVLVDSKTKEAKGVVFGKNGVDIEVGVKREVILSAGAIRTPQILMLSGIGPKKQLQKFGIEVIKDLPGVGENLMDHIFFLGMHFLINSTDSMTIKELISPWNRHLLNYYHYKKGPISSSGPQAIAFFDSKNKKAKTGAADMELLYLDASSMFGEPLFMPKVLAVKQDFYEKTYEKYRDRHAYQIIPVLVRPKSRGRVELTSTDAEVIPKLIANYFGDPDDVKTMIRGIRESQELSKTKALQKYGSTLLSEPISGCEEFKADSDEYWECALRTLALTIWHYSGTAKMGPNSDPMAVVDSRLRVHGIKRLRVADASIMPNVITGHTNLPTMMIGEKAADMIKEDHGFVKLRSRSDKKIEEKQKSRAEEL